MFEDTTGVIRRRTSKNDRQWNGQMFEDTTGVIRRRTSKKDRYTLTKRKRTKGQTMVYKTLKFVYCPPRIGNNVCLDKK